MAAVPNSATDDNPARARADAFDAQARELLTPMLPKPADASPNLRAALQTIVGAVLALKAKSASAKDHDKLVLARLAEIEQRLRALEAKSNGG